MNACLVLFLVTSAVRLVRMPQPPPDLRPAMHLIQVAMPAPPAAPAPAHIVSVFLGRSCR
jgi:hypothetical protein